MNKLTKHFYLFEFFDEQTFNSYREAQLISFLDQRVLHIADAMRDRWGKAYINTWFWGGRLEFSGYRPPWSIEVMRMKRIKVADNSSHCHGRAIDIKFEHATPDEVREDIKKDEHLWMCYHKITTVELDTPSHTHIDCRYTGIEPKILWIPRSK